MSRVARSITHALRVSPAEDASMRLAIAAIAADAPPGIEVGVGDYLRGLVLTDIRARGLDGSPPAPAPVAPQKAPAAPKAPAPPSRLRAAREAAGLSQNALAKVVGCDPSLVSQVERGKTTLAGDLLSWVEGRDATVAP